MNDVCEVEIIWNEWKAIPFPTDYAGEEVEDICIVSLDTFTAGCIDAFVSRKGSLDSRRISTLRKCKKDLEIVIGKLEGEAKLYFEQLLLMTLKVLAIVKLK